jgi:hypothetical protein
MREDHAHLREGKHKPTPEETVSDWPDKSESLCIKLLTVTLLRADANTLSGNKELPLESYIISTMRAVWNLHYQLLPVTTVESTASISRTCEQCRCTFETIKRFEQAQ